MELSSHVSVFLNGARASNVPTAFPQKALKEKRQKTKLEILDSGVYQVIARYLEIAGRNSADEILMRDKTQADDPHCR